MYPVFKRLIDIIVSATVMILLLPLLVPLFILLRCTGEGEIFYLQKRIGRFNGPFMIWKFATMLKNSPNIGSGAITVRNDPRITPMGKFLRRSKLNELPQVVNILKGDMSIVGPRPLMPVSFVQYTPEIQAKIYENRPGLTGIGSIIFRDEEKWVSESGIDPQEFYTKNIFPYKGAVEMWYHDNVSFLLDLKLVFLTAWSIVRPHNDLVFRVFPTLPKKGF